VTVDGRIATVEFTVAEGCRLELSLASYAKPEAGWSREMADRQRLVSARTGEFPGPTPWESSFRAIHSVRCSSRDGGISH
jgi:hypothetical protein